MNNKKVIPVKLYDKTLNKERLKSVAGEVSIKVINKNGEIEDIQKQNTVVIVGRNAMFQKLTDVIHTITDENGNNVTDARPYILNFFCIGSGGAPSSDPFNPVSPNQSDTKLASYIYIGDPSTSITNDKTHKLVDSKTFTNDTTMLVTFTIDFSEANPNEFGNGNAVFINEAGLSLGNVADSSADSFILFTRATFSTIEKTPDRKLEFEWYLYF